MEFLAQAGANLSNLGSRMSAAVSSAFWYSSSSSSFSSVVGEDYTADRDLKDGLVQLEAKYQQQQKYDSISDESDTSEHSRFMKRYKGRLLAASDVLTPKDDVTDTCDPETSQASCEAIDECRWDAPNSKCIDPILTTYKLATALDAPTITRGAFEKCIAWNFNRFTVEGLLTLPQSPSACAGANG